MNNDQSVSLSPESLRILERLRNEGQFDTLDQCLNDLLRRAEAVRPKKLELRVDERRCVFERLSDLRFRELAADAIAFQLSDEFLTYQIGNDNLKLAQTYAVCCTLFGERGQRFDDWKGAFSFPLALHIEGVSRLPAYLLNLFHYRSHVDVHCMQTVDRNDPRRTTNVLYKHEDSQVATSEFVRIMLHLIGFIEGYAETFSWSTPFVLAAPSDLVVYGFGPTQGFFNKQYDEAAAFDEALHRYHKTLPTPSFFDGAS